MVFVEVVEYHIDWNDDFVNWGVKVMGSFDNGCRDLM